MAKKKNKGQTLAAVAANIEVQAKRDREKAQRRKEHDEKYPMCEKLSSVSDERRMLTEFLEWCNAQGIWLCEHSPGENFDTYHPVAKRHDALILEHLEIDPVKLEEERRAMLEEVQEKASAGSRT